LCAGAGSRERSGNACRPAATDEHLALACHRKMALCFDQSIVARECSTGAVGLPSGKIRNGRIRTCLVKGASRVARNCHPARAKNGACGC
jgi:hypothetical protein